MQYDVISADCHVNEPPDTYTSRVPARLHDRVPRVEPGDEGGERWVFDDIRCVAFGPGSAVLARGKVRGPLDYVFDLTHAEVARDQDVPSNAEGHPYAASRSDAKGIWERDFFNVSLPGSSANGRERNCRRRTYPCSCPTCPAKACQIASLREPGCGDEIPHSVARWEALVDGPG